VSPPTGYVLQLGVKHKKRRRLKPSQHSFHQAIELREDSCSALYYRGEIKQGLSDFAGAACDYDTVIQLITFGLD